MWRLSTRRSFAGSARAKRGAAAHRPVVTERIVEATLPVWPPGHLVIDDRRSRRGSGGDGPRDEPVGIVHEQLDPDTGHAGAIGAGLGRIVRIDLVQEER